MIVRCAGRWLAACAPLAMLVLIACKPGVCSEPILLEIGQNTPNPAYMKNNLEEMELRPFDGVCYWMMYPYAKQGSLGPEGKLEESPSWAVFTDKPLTWDSMKDFVGDLKDIRFKRLNSNFIWVCSYSTQHIDWFDDSLWKTIAGNMRLVARAAKESGCLGIVFDPEQYAYAVVWNWSVLVEKTGSNLSFAEYAEKVRQRGRQLGAVIAEEFPGITIWCLHGYSWVSVRVHSDTDSGKSPEDSDYALYGPFLDGLYEGTDDRTIIVDGHELAYSYSTAEEFIQGRKMVLEDPLKVTQVPEIFKKKTRVGFGIWVDNRYDGFKWHARKPYANRFTPDRLQRTIYLALKYSDGYVWTWSEAANWWVDGPGGKPRQQAAQWESQRYSARGLDAAYHKALAEARTWPGIDTEFRERPTYASPLTLGYISDDELDELRDRTRPIMTLPQDDWLFKDDVDEKGVKGQWYLPATNTADWATIKIADVWEKQGFPYLDASGWYRREVIFPSFPVEKKTYMLFGAVDESMILWIDGIYVASYDQGANGWDKPFAVELTGKIDQGKHTLTIQVYDSCGLGGIWKPITLITEQ